jgi:hypothetical protein
LYESFGLLFGLELGLFGGLLLSGIYIMIFRAICHLGGRHE